MTVTLPAWLAEIPAEQEHPAAFATVSGAHLYGFPSSDSDVDLRGVHLLPLEEVIGLSTGEETLTRSWVRHGVEVDLVTHDLAKFCRLLLRRNGYVLEQLLSPLVVTTSPVHQELIAAKRVAEHGLLPGDAPDRVRLAHDVAGLTAELEGARDVSRLPETTTSASVLHDLVVRTRLSVRASPEDSR
ncbi:DNA polymerase beta superfamily protein [Streptosporangium lutulentum]|uniref:Nucleotidyltransferase n=1 Tax=Streptosporangium lutulentum TaxID=1461250 RepID=A0ABT9QD98_9ACTN|nr:nucleotidyltransferase domain-containing protein [Streptosporangium lutulentum]MDP9844293.1 hypothetical protein [Streptosporangium lutulentum]